MKKDYTFRYESNFEEILHAIKEKRPDFIAIDGRDGSGKTYLGRELHRALGGTRYTETDFRYKDQDGRFHINLDALNQELKTSTRMPLIFDCCLMYEHIPVALRKPDLVIYVKSLESNYGEWADGDDLYSDEKEPTPFRQQMKDYHKQHKPDAKADLIYTVKLVVE